MEDWRTRGLEDWELNLPILFPLLQKWGQMGFSPL
jgi:hypothetical protein